MQWTPTDWFSGYFGAAWNDGEYASFPTAPCPLENVGDPALPFCNLSGRPLPALSDGFDASYRSEWYSDASVSQYGLIVIGAPGDPCTVGLTIRAHS